MTYQMNSRGDGVRRLQEALNTKGYGLAEDGIYGPKTRSAVRDYQSKNGLAVDGIAGNQTLTALGLSAGEAAPAPASGVNGASGSAGRVSSTYEYVPGPGVQAAAAGLTAAEGAAAGYAPYDSRWSGEMDRLLGALEGDSFSYDPASDPLYQIYRDSYLSAGQQAAEDTSARAAALTGGYGNSYAATAAGQAYESYLDGLAQQGSALYQLARDRYDADREALAQEYDRYAARESADYARWRDGLDRLLEDRDAAREAYSDAWDRDYAAYELLRRLLASA